MNKRLQSLLVTVLLFQCITGLPQSITVNNIQRKDVDYGRLARIDTLVNSYIDKGWVHGVVTLVVKGGEIVQYKGYGYADAESRKPMHKDDLFRIASQTKAIVSTAIMILYEEGKFTLDEPIADFLPAWRNPSVLNEFHASDTTYTTVPAKRDITFRDLLTHTGGLDYSGIGTEKMRAIYAKAGIPSGLGVVDHSLRDRMDVLAKLPLGSQPGEKWTYSLSIDVLGCLVEVISGKNLEQFCMERIFRPLGMKDTYFNVPASKASRLTIVYMEDSLHHIVRWTKDHFAVDPDYPLKEKHYFSGGAGLTSTAYDYALFLQTMLNGGVYNGVRILSPRTVQMMTSGQLSFLFNGMDNFGLGFGITSELSGARGPLNAGSFYWGGFFGTTYWADPKAGLVCLIMTQENPNSHGDLAAKVEQLIYQSLR
ncbi:MAG: serine hydrolase [Sphingobacteriales bacterium 50-39]|nr:beta-lactamase family protein [Sphingobacteriales bacterium]OJW61020.1 MAG: serine hydrolase [Sphingobacteriales bacterium 50-39]